MKMKIWILGVAALVAAASVSFAAETRIWSLGDRADFEKAKLEGLSLTSDGRLALAPVFKEALDSASVYLWALAEDSKGNVYAGGGGPGGPGAKLYVIPHEGAGKAVASFDELEVHALAIDSKDQVYVGTAPDGKVYRMRGGKPEIFYDPKAKYIWAMAFDRAGNLFVATGNGGEVHRVTPAGKGEVFYRSSETHARSMAIDPQGNVVIGTEPGGLIIRVNAKGQGFVLYQTPKREVTAVAVDREGAIWAAAVGTRQTSTAPAVSAPATPAAAPAPANPAGAAAPATPRIAVQPAAPAPVAPASIPGGSEVYRIGSDGFPKRVWTDAQDVVYSLGFDRDGRPLAGTGNKGRVYRIDSDLVSTELVNAPPSQVTAILSGRGGRIWTATGNVGKVYRMGPEIQKSGSAESEVFDAGLYSKWGRLTWRGQVNGGRITFATRSGNLDRPQTDWSAWSPEITELHGGPTSSPAARFVQWRADLTAAPDGRSPVLNAVDVAYLPHNVAPSIREIETTPPNYRFPPASATASSNAQTLSLPALGAAPRQRSRSVTPPPTAPAMQAAHGFVGARWAASDENGDTLTYSIYIRGENESGWKLLKDKLAEAYYSWDSTAFPDGDYRVRVVASDAPDNPAGQALTAESVSEPFTIDNTPPVITELSVTPSGNNLAIKWNARDALSVVAKAEYSINGSEWTLAPPVSGVSDSRAEEYAITVERPAPGELTVAVRAADEFENRSVAKTVLK